MPNGEERPDFFPFATFDKRPDKVRAAQVRPGRRVRVLLSKDAGVYVVARAGQWIVRHPDRTQEIMSNAEFTAKYVASA